LRQGGGRCTAAATAARCGQAEIVADGHVVSSWVEWSSRGYFGTINSVKNNPPRVRGPRPARAQHPRLSAARVSLLETLQAQTEPVGIDALVSATGLHANTLREHLEGLRDLGLVTRSAAPASGRGRPAWRYAATQESADDPRPEYAGLAVALARVIV